MYLVKPSIYYFKLKILKFINLQLFVSL
uniref:Uncharacterized protein n=1 Tax=Arundo donax TaxID=35708 RepID=A0A0A9C5A2_ARUDO